jgi:uncharacterized membrane protein HdeD (DUF308 family)
MGIAPTFMGVAGPPRTEDLVEALRRARRRLMTAGILAVVLGVIAIVVPAIASVATAIFIGWILVVASGLQFADALAVGDRRRAALRAVLGGLTFAAGLYLLLSPLDGTFTLTVMLVLWFVATGVGRIAFGIAEWNVPGARMTILSGVLALALGLMVALKLPESADWAIGLLVGVDLLFAGTALIALGRAVRPLIPDERAR